MRFFLSGRESVQAFLFVYIWIAIADPVIKKGGLGSHYPVEPATFFCMSQAESVFLGSYYAEVPLFFVLSHLRWEVVVHFVILVELLTITV